MTAVVPDIVPRRLTSAVRVGMVTPRYAPHVGGVEAHVAGLATGLATQGAGVDIITQARRPASRRDGSVRVQAFREIVPSDAYPVAPGVLRWLRQHADDLDVVHAHSYHGAPAAAAAAAARGAFVFTPHYHGTGHTRFARALHRPYAMIGRRIFDRADRIICVSQSEADLVADHHPRVVSRIDVVPNAVDVDGITAADPFDLARPVVLVLGRLVGYKRVDAVIRSMAELQQDAELVVVGEGPAQSALMALADDLAVPARFTGRVETPEVHRWLRTASVVVSASAHEAFGLTLLEALTAGARLVASDLPAHREVAERWAPRGTASVVPDMRGLREAIEEQLEGGPVPVTGCPRWSWSDMASVTSAIYAEVVRGA